MARPSYKAEALKLDPGARYDRIPWDYGIGEGRIGTRQVIRDGSGVIIAHGDAGCGAGEVWRRGLVALRAIVGERSE